MVAPALRVTEGNARVYRRTWRGSVISTFLNPVLFMLAMGLGLGALVDENPSNAGLGISYLEFLAPGLLAATAMQIGASDSSFAVMAGHRWTKTYYAILATPVGIGSLVYGHLWWVTLRLTFTSVVFVGIMALFGASPLWLGLVAVIPAVLTGMAFAGPTAAYAAWLDDAPGLTALFRFGIVPMFLFSGTFFPITQLPAWLQPVAYATPLWHGVALCRAITLGVETPAHWAVHVGYLVVWVVAGVVAARYFFHRRLSQ